MIRSFHHSKLQSAAGEEQASRQNRDRSEETAGQNAEHRGDQHPGEKVILQVLPATRLRQAGRIVFDMPALQMSPDEPVESVDQCAERTEIAAEGARDNHAERDDAEHPPQRRPVQNSASKCRREADQRIDQQERFDRQRLLFAERCGREMLGIRPAYSKKPVKKHQQTDHLNQSSDRCAASHRTESLKSPPRDSTPPFASTLLKVRKEEVCGASPHFKPAFFKALNVPATMASFVTVAPLIPSTCRLCLLIMRRGIITQAF